jgi:hypothetical protein
MATGFGSRIHAPAGADSLGFKSSQANNPGVPGGGQAFGINLINLLIPDAPDSRVHGLNLVAGFPCGLRNMD